MIEGQETTAYQIGPPQSDADDFLATGSRLYLRLPGWGCSDQRVVVLGPFQ